MLRGIYVGPALAWAEMGMEKRRGTEEGSSVMHCGRL
jgi:hypothetical protein